MIAHTQNRINLLKMITSLIPQRAVRFIYLTLLSPKPLRWLTDRVIGFFIPHILTIDEGTVVLNQSDVAVSGSLCFGAHDPFEIEQFRNNLRKGMIVVDIGANVGYYTVIAAARVGSQGRVLAFEPESNNFALLTKNIKSNNFHWASGFRLALSDAPGTRTFFLADSHTGIHSFINNRGVAHQVDMTTDTLDRYLCQQKCPPVDIIKMDIEGAEILALEGMRQTIMRSAKLVLFTEFYPQAIERLGRQPIEFLNNLKMLGFSLSVIDENKRKIVPLPPESFAKYLSNFPKKGEVVNNLYCVKTEMH